MMTLAKNINELKKGSLCYHETKGTGWRWLVKVEKIERNIIFGLFKELDKFFNEKLISEKDFENMTEYGNNSFDDQHNWYIYKKKIINWREALK